MPLSAAADLGLHCLPMSHKKGTYLRLIDLCHKNNKLKVSCITGENEHNMKPVHFFST